MQTCWSLPRGLSEADVPEFSVEDERECFGEETDTSAEHEPDAPPSDEGLQEDNAPHNSVSYPGEDERGGHVDAPTGNAPSTTSDAVAARPRYFLRHTLDPQWSDILVHIPLWDIALEHGSWVGHPAGPLVDSSDDTSVVVAGQWEMRYTASRGMEEGESFFIHRGTGETRWDPPDEWLAMEAKSGNSLDRDLATEWGGPSDAEQGGHEGESGADVHPLAGLHWHEALERLGWWPDALLDVIARKPVRDNDDKERSATVVHMAISPSKREEILRDEDSNGDDSHTAAHLVVDAIESVWRGSADATWLCRRLAALCSLMETTGEAREWVAVLCRHDCLLLRLVMLCWAPSSPAKVAQRVAQLLFFVGHLDPGTLLSALRATGTVWTGHLGEDDSDGRQLVPALMAWTGPAVTGLVRASARWTRRVPWGPSDAVSLQENAAGWWEHLPRGDGDEDSLVAIFALLEILADLEREGSPAVWEEEGTLRLHRDLLARALTLSLERTPSSVFAPAIRALAAVVTASPESMDEAGEETEPFEPIPSFVSAVTLQGKLLWWEPCALFQVLNRTTHHDEHVSVGASHEDVAAAVTVARFLLSGPEPLHGVYSSDVEVLMDITIRELEDLPLDSTMRVVYLELLEVVFDCPLWLKQGRFRVDDVVRMLSVILEETSLEQPEEVRQVAERLLVDHSDALEE